MKQNFKMKRFIKEFRSKLLENALEKHNNLNYG
jgi:hypothetical protein